MFARLAVQLSERLPRRAGRAAQQAQLLDLRVRVDIIGHARKKLYVNLSHACFEMAD